MEKEIEYRIQELRDTLEQPYLGEGIREDKQEDLDLLLRFKRAMYGY
jgi:hypothetical protein